ncbi:hypothetical protein RN001_008405 [Aquatica leii]|uniref:Uncharacterized protein n=1 Tax=Aquatica leii TaxID=1421715 RepID=A0AAN7SH90_9COLE|nr:hypothetical protein RN001_008405 [Aquatica leii]
MSNNSCNGSIKIWSEFTVKGKRFWIQSVDDTHIDLIANTMATDFLRDEPLGKYGKVLEDSSFLRQHKLSYYETLRKGQSIVCMTENEHNQPIIAGIHCQETTFYPPVEGEFRFGFSLLFYLLELNNICKDLNVQKFLVDRGLFVFPEYRGNDIECELLKCWTLTCKNSNVKLGLGLFSSKHSQRAAKRAGLVELMYLSYKDVRKTFPDQIPIGVEEHTEGLKLYYLRKMPFRDYHNPATILKEFKVGGKHFWIQIVEECYVDELVKAMTGDYQKEEPIAYFTNAFDDIEYITKCRDAYNDIFRKGYSIVCLTTNELGKPTIAGVHCLDLVPYQEVKDEFVFGHSYVWHLLQFKNICIEKNINKYLVDRGMYVFPEFQRKGIGSELLKCWFLLCKRLKIQLCMGTFSSKYSQVAADRAGLIKLKYLPYHEIRKVFPGEIPEGIEVHSEGMALYYAEA